MKILLISLIMLSNSLCEASDAALRRSNAVIAGVWSTDVAICGSTLKTYHDDCQLTRGTQKCPDCSSYDVEFLTIHAAQKLSETCGLCGREIVYTSGFSK